MENSKNQTSTQTINFYASRVNFDIEGRLLIRGYFINSGANIVKITDMELKISRKTNNILEQPITSSMFRNLNIIVDSGEVTSWTFRISGVPNVSIANWGVYSTFNWELQE